ncbi:twin-arginine translocation signal domain-containing protein [Labrys wisconsinensis]|uniref:Twin-arginine translocation pathway signal n=1 Tax=Labrys wisconsinensis TaxID=425677 RepID=A0ABU0J3R3_9HYPH|nr:twin-arginine translocation signal domain-containing protein [Labrys wisconsinensis]MDQ0468874.1 hypothetical protein [Labrys wisconsinensis]
MRAARSTSDISRRRFMAGAAMGAALVVIDGAVFCPSEAWALEATTLKPETVHTLIRMSRDVYPHDRLGDRTYAVAVKGFDAAAAKDPASRTLFEDGVTTLDGLAANGHAGRYVDVAWEADRLALLRQIENTPFFATVRSGLVVGLYNQKEVWPIFGYEGASAPLGGYIHRGFDDIDWL